LRAPQAIDGPNEGGAIEARTARRQIPRMGQRRNTAIIEITEPGAVAKVVHDPAG
jgi:hypothetical protein